jgi:hypothetical protein
VLSERALLSFSLSVPFRSVCLGVSLAHSYPSGERSFGVLLDPLSPIHFIVGDVIFMSDRKSAGDSQKAVRDRRYAIRYPFAADAEVLDLESGARAEGVTSDISLGGCFVCTSKPLAVKSRARVTLVRKDETVQALAMVRIVKPRIGMGLEFIDVEPSTTSTLTRWLDQLRHDR